MADVDSVNQQFSRYDQVRKSHTYRLAEDASDEFDDNYEIATLDLAPFLNGGAAEKQHFADEFASALQEIGFAVLVGHGVDPALYEATHESALDLMTSTPMSGKMRFRAQRHGSVNQGYFPIEETSAIHPDLVEGWVFCRRAFDIPQMRDAEFRAEDFWPSAPYEPQFRSLVLAHERLFKPIAQAMLQGLGCDPHLLDDKLTGTNFGLRL
ncbi:MAG: 2-oxoglutarate and iron-dependent oxygenase domain-containing protein, partial [Sphingomicrobium sp.]